MTDSASPSTNAQGKPLSTYKLLKDPYKYRALHPSYLRGTEIYMMHHQEPLAARPVLTRRYDESAAGQPDRRQNKLTLGSFENRRRRTQEATKSARPCCHRLWASLSTT